MIVNNMTEIDKIDKYVKLRIQEFRGLSVTELKLKLNLKTTAKNTNSLIISRIMDLTNLDLDTLLFLKKNYVFKTVNVNSKNKVTESMSFPAIDYVDMVKNNWEKSAIYKYFSTKHILIFVFRTIKDENYLIGYITLKLNKNNLYNIFLIWEKVKNMILNNELIIGGKHGFSVENFPKKDENEMIHIRPHDTNATEGKVLLPNGKRIMNYCFWINNTYIENEIKKGGLL